MDRFLKVKGGTIPKAQLSTQRFSDPTSLGDWSPRIDEEDESPGGRALQHIYGNLRCCLGTFPFVFINRHMQDKHLGATVGAGIWGVP